VIRSGWAMSFRHASQAEIVGDALFPRQIARLHVRDPRGEPLGFMPSRSATAM
jgi:hypothetical protein